MAADHLHTRVPLELLLDTRVTPPAFKLWCWIDHLNQAAGRPVLVQFTQLHHDTGIGRVTAARACRNLIETGWLELQRVGRYQTGDRQAGSGHFDGRWKATTTHPVKASRDTSSLPRWVHRASR